jgi:hypothetical protein
MSFPTFSKVKYAFSNSIRRKRLTMIVFEALGGVLSIMADGGS